MKWMIQDKNGLYNLEYSFLHHTHTESTRETRWKSPDIIKNVLEFLVS